MSLKKCSVRLWTTSSSNGRNVLKRCENFTRVSPSHAAIFLPSGSLLRAHPSRGGGFPEGIVFTVNASCGHSNATFSREARLYHPFSCYRIDHVTALVQLRRRRSNWRRQISFEQSGLSAQRPQLRLQSLRIGHSSEIPLKLCTSDFRCNSL